MKKLIIILLIFIFANIISDKAFCAPDSSTNAFDVTITQDQIPPGGDDSSNKDTGGLSPGAIVGIAAGVGTPTAAGAGATLAAPLVLAGLFPNSPVSAAAPITCFKNFKSFLKIAIREHFDSKDYASAKTVMDNSSSFYLAKNDSAIKNGTFDINTLRVPKELLNTKSLQIHITVASEPYKEVNTEPELVLGVYKNINSKDLKRKFETQQFLHNYFMKKYEIPLEITSKDYANGIQKISGTLNLSQLKNKTLPLGIVTRYTYNGFQTNQRKVLPKTLTYAYLIELEK